MILDPDTGVEAALLGDILGCGDAVNLWGVFDGVFIGVFLADVFAVVLNGEGGIPSIPSFDKLLLPTTSFTPISAPLGMACVSFILSTHTHGATKFLLGNIIGCILRTRFM